MPLFRALAKNMAPMTNADESPTNRLTLFVSFPAGTKRCCIWHMVKHGLDWTTELYYISGDRALAKKVWQKTWRISFPEELLRSLDSCCQPLTMAQVLVGTEFTPP